MFKHLTLSLAALALLAACSIKDDRLAGLATVNTGFSNTVGISTAVGAPSTSSTCLFLASDEQTLDVTIEVLDADGHVLSSKLVEDVPFRRNRKTKLTGSIYSAPAAGSFLLSTGWLSDIEMSF